MSFGAITGEPEELVDANLGLAAVEGGYNPPDVEADQDAIAQQVFADLAARVDGWEAHDGNLDVWLIEAFAEVAAEIRSLAADVPASIFATYGTRVLGVPPDPALASQGLATFTAIDSQGYTLDVGATFTLARSGNDLVAFQTLQDATITPGSTSVTNVPFSAVIVGGDSNGLAGDGVMADPISWVSDVNVPVPTSGGQDEETADDYLDRLTNLMSMMALRPILPQDFAILALQVDGCGRAVAMNCYDPVAKTWTNAKTITLVVTDDSGNACASNVKSTISSQLAALREVNWVINVIDAHYATVGVTFAVVAYVGQDVTAVNAACVAALTAALQPSQYRLGVLSPAIAGGEVINPPTSGSITRRQVIRVNDLIALLDRTLGVDYVVSVALTGSLAAHLTSTLSTGAAITTLPITGLVNTIPSGGTVTLTSSDGLHTQTFTTTAQANPGASTIAVASQTPNYAYTSAATMSASISGDYTLADSITLPTPGAITGTVTGGTG